MIFCELGALQNFKIIGQANLELSQQKNAMNILYSGVPHCSFCSLCSLKNGNCSFFFKEHLLGQMFFILGN